VGDLNQKEGTELTNPLPIATVPRVKALSYAKKDREVMDR